MSKKLLIVDDDDTIRMCITKYCNDNGVIPDSVESGAEAIEKLKSNSYDGIIVDFTLNDMNGEEVLNQIKPGGNYGKAILMSGTPNMDYQSKGFDFFLEKPIKVSTFKDLVGKL